MSPGHVFLLLCADLESWEDRAVVAKPAMDSAEGGPAGILFVLEFYQRTDL